MHTLHGVDKNLEGESQKIEAKTFLQIQKYLTLKHLSVGYATRQTLKTHISFCSDFYCKRNTNASV